MRKNEPEKNNEETEKTETEIETETIKKQKLLQIEPHR